MWNQLSRKQRDKYKALITNFASLSEAFAQKTTDDEIVAPIVNSKFQEAAFQKAFHANSEDISNTSYDASICLENGQKYIVGIKSFGLHSGDQKIAQFKKESRKWSLLVSRIIDNAKKCRTIDEVNYSNRELYKELVEYIATLRNIRIKSSIENLRGFSIKEDDEINSIYHVLMPTRKGEKPKIYVGETDYTLISIDDVEIKGCTSMKTPGNFKFIDHKYDHEYKYTVADSQLYMKFNNKNIILEEWPIEYIDDAFSFFESLHNDQEVNNVAESYSWKIDIQPYSGYNSFYGVGSKLAKSDRQKRIDKILNISRSILETSLYNKVKIFLYDFLMNNNDFCKDELAIRRREIMMDLKAYPDIQQEIAKLVYRPMKEMYIPIPNSKKFHKDHPNFFGILSPSGRSEPFILEFLPSHDHIMAEVRQQGGKAIQSIDRQSILGNWILNKVFQLKPYEQLTNERLESVGINGLRLRKIKDKIQLEFIWIDDNHKPYDYWE